MAAPTKKRSVAKKAPAARQRRVVAKKAQRPFIDATTAWIAIFAALCLVFLAMAAATYIR